MWVAVDKDGSEYIYKSKPTRNGIDLIDWLDLEGIDEHVEVPKGTIERLLNYPLTWDDEAEEITGYKKYVTQTPKEILEVADIYFKSQGM